MRDSIYEYLCLLLRYWWIMLVGILIAVIGGGFNFAQSTGIVLLTVPIWVYRLMWIIGLVFVAVVSPFFAYNTVRSERDRARDLLESRPSLWIRNKGSSLLSDPINGMERRLAWYFGVNIANTSPTISLGIRSIVLQIPRSGYMAPLRPHLGTPTSEFSNSPPSGDIGGTFSLRASEAISGTLVFVEELNTLSVAKDDAFDGATIVIIDSQNQEHEFPTDNVLEFTNR